MNLYTKQGDGGFSNLADGKRLKKSERVFHILGSLDETSCFLGLAKCMCGDESLFAETELVQKDLQRLMAHIASGNDKKYALDPKCTKYLEERTDFYYSKSKDSGGFDFVLPGGSKLSAVFNLARCSARKAERLMCEDGTGYKKCGENLEYINRLSDFLYAAALYCDKKI